MSYHYKDIFTLFPSVLVGCIYEIIGLPKITLKVAPKTDLWYHKIINMVLKLSLGCSFSMVLKL